MSYLVALLKHEIHSRGMSQNELADRAGIASSTLTHIFQRPERVPDLTTLQRLSRALDIPLRRLIEACGFTVEQLAPDQDGQIRAIVAALPQLQPYMAQLAQLSPEDLLLVGAYIQGLADRAVQQRGQ